MKSKKEEFSIVGYEDFLLKSRKKVNLYLNIVLWFFVAAGPAIALGIKLGFFKDISYLTCAVISGSVVLMAVIHIILMSFFPKNLLTSLFALIAMDTLLVYMTLNHVSIYLTWFLVPLLSIVLCDKNIYIFAVVFNYILMFATTWQISGYEASFRKEYSKPLEYFLDTIGGFTIESVIMLVTGTMIVRLIIEHLKKLINQDRELKESIQSKREKMHLLTSMADIYDNVNLIDFINSTEQSLKKGNETKHSIDMREQTHTLMNQRVKKSVMGDQLDSFLDFTNIKTVRSRLSYKKLISADFLDIKEGWFRAQYITVDSSLDGIPNLVIYTTRNVDEEKRREEHLVRLSLTDEMTRLYNRRCYDEDLNEYKATGLDDDFVIFSIDVNGLKKVNDTMGHAAGDELIKGAAECIAMAISSKGRAYRTGGDEFCAIVNESNPEEIVKKIREKTSKWHGMYVEEMALSIGYATHKDNPKASLDELEHIADSRMYADKDQYYVSRGLDRRKR
ncbi:sensor domain-containing diguanylate cyclase [Eubacterium xylanophilum]|uniref:sensor domain-containing diguanylate cyclase n=1 Tax=Eubacterium xylanophilum TaxID=39497 RepID=UPI000479C3B7|nr:GGDEF domain-containing protein [Eubacterium xylanophilum]